MATEIKLPRLGQGMESGTIVKWLKSEGDMVEKGEPLYELDTDKVTQEVEADASGILLKIAVVEGEVEVGRTIAVIGEQGEKVETETEQPSGNGDSAVEEAVQRPVRDSGPGEGVRGNREVPPTSNEVLDGVRLVHRSLSDLLAKQGLAEIATDGKFDPHVHEALLTQPSDAEEGSIIEVVQKGYKLGDKVLRPARVVVASAPED